MKSIISKASNSKADILVESGEKIHFGDLFLEVGRDVSGSSFLIYSILNFTKNSYSLSMVCKDDLYPSISTTRKEQIKFYWDFVCKEIIYPHGGILKVYLCGLFGIRTVAFLVMGILFGLSLYGIWEVIITGFIIYMRCEYKQSLFVIQV